MNDLPLTRATAAFVMGGGYVATMAFVAERFGSKVGGLVLALPSTALIGAVFIAAGEGRAGLHDAAVIMPATIGAAVIFLAVFVAFISRGFLVAYGSAVCVWACLTVPQAAWQIHDIRISIGLGVSLVAVGIFVFRNTPHRTARSRRQPRRAHVVRVSVAGGICAATVFVAEYAGPMWGGVCASFPAVFSATLYLITRAQGIEFVTALGRTMTFGCMANVFFAIALYAFTAELTAPIAIPAAYLCSLGFAALAHFTLVDMGRRKEHVVMTEAPTGMPARD